MTFVKVNRKIKITAFLCWLGLLFDFYDLIIIAFLIPAIEVTLQIDSHISVWLLGIALGASGIGSILFGWLADIYGRKPMLTCTVLLFSLGMLATALTQTPEQFFIARFITGIGLGGEWAVGYALLAESVPAITRARWGAILTSGEPIGVALAAVIGFLLTPYLGWRGVFIISASTGLLTLFFRRHLQESPIWLQQIKPTQITWGKKLIPFLKDYKILLFFAAGLVTLKAGTYWTCYTWLPRFVKQSYGLDIGKSALWIICGQLGQFIGMYIFGYAADKWGRRISFTLFALVTSFSLLLLACNWNLLFQNYHFFFWLVMFLLGVGSGCTPGIGTIMTEIFPTAQRTFAMSFAFSIGRSLQLFSPVIVGMAVAAGGIFGGLLIPAFLALVSGCWIWLFPNKQGVELKEVYLVED